ncbi:SWI/SNF complex subunit SWI3C-like [Salvia divinorum]|uniref:SWI/SNF complex subunit SWI3C-like n=1 Tax=Salvia divinorum TaxID=28513 RepID=A0ABD1FTS6_SALDI
MSLVAFLASTLGPRVAAACAHVSLSSLSKESSIEGSPGGYLSQHDAEGATLFAEKVISAAEDDLTAAAMKAKLFADHEEREIPRLSANIINHQLSSGASSPSSAQSPSSSHDKADDTAGLRLASHRGNQPETPPWPHHAVLGEEGSRLTLQGPREIPPPPASGLVSSRVAAGHKLPSAEVAVVAPSSRRFSTALAVTPTSPGAVAFPRSSRRRIAARCSSHNCRRPFLLKLRFCFFSPNPSYSCLLPCSSLLSVFTRLSLEILCDSEAGDGCCRGSIRKRCGCWGLPILPRAYEQASAVLKKRKQRRTVSALPIASVHGSILALAACVLSAPHDIPSSNFHPCTHVAFLASTLGPRVAAACAHVSLSSLSKESSTEGSPGGYLSQHDAEGATLSAEKVFSAAEDDLTAAAMKAKLFADHEEREIPRLYANIINHQCGAPPHSTATPPSHPLFGSVDDAASLASPGGERRSLFSQVLWSGDGRSKHTSSSIGVRTNLF